MTFIIGFICPDGVLLCTDSLEADGLTKRPVDKVRMMGTTDWGVAIAGAGASGMVDKFSDEVSSRIGRGAYDRKHIEQTIEEVLIAFRSQYPEDGDQFRVLIATYCISAIERRLYRSDTTHLAPIKDLAHIGTGHSLWRFLSAKLYAHGNSVEDNSRLAVFIMDQAIDYVDGVDGPVRLVSYTFGDQSWKVARGPFFSFEKFERAFRPYDVGKALRDSWKLCNPPSLSEQVTKFGGVRTPGDELTFLTGVEAEKLRTVSGRSKNEGFLYGNRGRLRKRALLEQERAKPSEKQNQ
jgi:20S proteasome alpha/beta subunit